MKITHLETVPYRIPMKKPLKFASGAVHHIEHVLLRLHTDDGLVGTADIPPRPYTYGETVESVIAVINTVFSDALIGADPLDRATIHSKLHRTIGNQTAKGGVDIALWDLIGQAYSTPVHRSNTSPCSHFVQLRIAAHDMPIAAREGFAERVGPGQHGGASCAQEQRCGWDRRSDRARASRRSPHTLPSRPLVFEPKV